MSKFVSLRRELLQKQQELTQLMKQVDAARKAELLSLPEYVGLSSVDELVRALSPYTSTALQQAIARAGRDVTARGRRLRATITPELRARIVEAIAARSATAVAIAHEFNVSVSAVNAIKAAEKLTKRRVPSRRPPAGTVAEQPV